MVFQSDKQDNEPVVDRRPATDCGRRARAAATTVLGTRCVAVGAALVLACGGSTAIAGIDPPPPAEPVETQPVRKAKAARVKPEPKPEWRIPPFWQRLAECETGGRWDWGRLARSPGRRHLEGTRFEGGLGFAASTWQLWAGAVDVVDEYPHAWMAPPRVQVRVGAYGLRRGGSWGCLRYAYG
jgi:hypothetical protein